MLERQPTAPQISKETRESYCLIVLTLANQQHLCPRLSLVGGAKSGSACSLSLSLSSLLPLLVGRFVARNKETCSLVHLKVSIALREAGTKRVLDFGIVEAESERFSAARVIGQRDLINLVHLILCSGLQNNKRSIDLSRCTLLAYPSQPPTQPPSQPPSRNRREAAAS